MNAIALAAALSVAAFAGAALAEDRPIATGRAGDPPTAQAQAQAAPISPGLEPTLRTEAPGDWARRVMAGEPAPEEIAEAQQGRCPTRVDNKPHGQVWGSVGTGGYREIGGVVTQPLGDCATVTIGMSRTEGRFAGPRYR
ncbi:MAG: hypothetical protein Q8L59_00600 [Phenylobacterium sp.]|uniref:hypothetical protein n=1 Tax=Phenylobacterium sp. TaxID=1871053 RepID=UPI002735F0A4|nr:hypothetical protein [Phenylobacterium sp.]MDP1640661.1 hypothetical protein [Phenylobacterium sp.]MDP3116064.1 hypothetical protein [Phenylobacterium sp.]